MFRAILAIFTLFLCGLTAPSTVLAKDSSTKSPQTEAVKFDQQAVIDEYNALVKQSYAMPEDYDFVRLRELFSKQPTYNPYIDSKDGFKKLFQDFEKYPDKKDENINGYIEKHFALMRAHHRMSNFYKHKSTVDEKKEEKQKYHYWMWRGLLKAMAQGTIPETREKAHMALTVGEEYLIARELLEEDTIKQELETIDGEMYDVLKGKSQDTGKDMELWFHITHFFARKQFLGMDKPRQD